uniref:Peptidase S1 domain-containing protein n=1 Tax=Takifugu rubripes TaxID=31033 RepID=A0A3B5K680_TAKRU
MSGHRPRFTSAPYRLLVLGLCFAQPHLPVHRLEYMKARGDSGGPLLCNGALVGVTSFGRRCGRVPGVYAYITEEHLRWIKKIIRTSEMQE